MRGCAVPAVFFPMITFCGILYQRSATPAYLKWMEQASIVNYGFSSIVATQAAAMPPQVPFRDLVCRRYLHAGCRGLHVVEVVDADPTYP
jgi:hypothetical protein